MTNRFAARFKHLTATLFAVALCTVSGCAFDMAFSTDSDPEIKATIRAMLNQQVDAWNAGNIDGFMAHYWRDPDVRFASGGDVKRGWQRVLDQYRERYPDRSAMGVLTTREIDVTLLSPEEGYVFGRWIVTAKGEDFCGLFTLVVRDINNQWVIVHDHTSMSAGPAADGRSCSDIKAS